MAEDETPVITPDPVEAASGAPATAPVSAEMQAVIDGYTVDAWHGHSHYNCASCPFDTLSEDEILLHVYHIHVRPTPNQTPATVPLYDRYGSRL